MFNNVCGSSLSQFNVKCWAVLGFVKLWLGIHYSYVKGLLLNHAPTILWIVELIELFIIFFSTLIIMHLIYISRTFSSKCWKKLIYKCIQY